MLIIAEEEGLQWHSVKRGVYRAERPNRSFFIMSPYQTQTSAHQLFVGSNRNPSASGRVSFLMRIAEIIDAESIS